MPYITRISTSSYPTVWVGHHEPSPLIEPPRGDAGSPSCRCRWRYDWTTSAATAVCAALLFFAALTGWSLSCLCAPNNSSPISRRVTLIHPQFCHVLLSSTSDFAFFASMSATFSSLATRCTSKFSISYCVLQPEFLRVCVARLSDATPVDDSQCCTCVCS